MMRLSHRAFVPFLLAVLSCPVLASTSVAYTRLGGEAWLIDWQPGARARVVTAWGHRLGTVSGTERSAVVTFDTPHSEEAASEEPCDDIGEVWAWTVRRTDTLQAVVTRTGGTAQRGESTIATRGTVTTLEGCGAGTVRPFGDADAGVTFNHLAMSLRPSTQDLIPGASLAGPAEGARWGVVSGPTTGADLLTLYAGQQARFARTGTVVPTSFTPDRWLVLQLPGIGERAYARVSVDADGAEIWLDADWSGGAPVAVYTQLMARATANPAFTSVREAARNWQSATVGRSRFYLPLFEDYTGEQIGVTADGVLRDPLTWRFAGTDLIRTRQTIFNLPPGPPRITERVRTWTPVARSPDKKIIFVLEQHVLLRDGVELPALFTWRVNYFYDRGVGVPARHYGPLPREEETFDRVPRPATAGSYRRP